VNCSPCFNDIILLKSLNSEYITKCSIEFTLGSGFSSTEEAPVTAAAGQAAASAAAAAAAAAADGKYLHDCKKYST